GVPVHLAQAARLERHIDSGELVRDRKLGDGRLLCCAPGQDLLRDAVKVEAERGKGGPRKRWRRRPILRLFRVPKSACAVSISAWHGVLTNPRCNRAALRANDVDARLATVRKKSLLT